MPIVYLEFLWRNYHCCSFRRCILLQKYLYIEMLLSTFCICSLEHGEPKYGPSLISICNVVAERMRYPHPQNVFVKFSITSAHQRTDDGHVIEMTIEKHFS